MTRVEANAAFLRNIYEKGPSDGHGFVCQPPRQALHERPLGDYTISSEPVEKWVPGIVADYRRQQQFLQKLDDHTVPMASLGCGTHLYAAAFGCPVHEYDDSNPCALPLVSSAAQAHRLEEPDIWKSPTLYRVFELARALLDELGPQAYLGPPDLQSGFDTACLVWNKEDLWRSMLLQPDAVQRLVRKCASLLRTFLQELRSEFPTLVPGHCPRAWVPPDMGFWVSNDECGAFNTQLFERFCLPELIDLSQTFGGFGMHCCADAEHQFEAFKRIPHFYAFNRVPGARGWDTLLEHFDGPDAPVHVLAWVPPDRARQLTRTASPHTRFIFVYHSQSLEDAQRWLDEMRVPSPQ